MQLSLSERERDIRDETRAFLAANLPAPEDIPDGFDDRVAFLREWQRRLHEAGLVGVGWPEEYGGRGASQIEQIVAYQEMARAGAPEVIGEIGLEVVGPSLIAHGTDAQKARFVRPILSAEEIWAQGFSEPGAGSDLASLTTRAVVRDDHFVLTGQKTWTSYVKYSQWCAVLARTDDDAAPHRGISYLLVDLASPGIEIRPLVLSTGDPEFGEVFFENVIVPGENLLGELHGGWPIAMHTLAHERGPAAMRNQVKIRVLLDRLVAEAGRIQRDGGPAIDSPAIQTALGRALVAVEVLKCQTLLSAGQAQSRGGPGAESSVDKVVSALTEQHLTATAMEVEGPYAGEAWHHAYLYGRATSVFGGSSQIQKNIIAERILGLPRSR